MKKLKFVHIYFGCICILDEVWSVALLLTKPSDYSFFNILLLTLIVVAIPIFVCVTCSLFLIWGARRRRLVKKRDEYMRALSVVEPFSGYRSIPTTDFLALKERLAEVNARLAELDQLNVSVPYQHLTALGVDKLEKYVPPAPTTKVVSFNWVALKQFLYWKGTIEELKRLKLK